MGMKMKELFKKILFKKLSKTNIVIGRVTPKEKVASLIKKLHPYQFDNGLIRIGPNRDGGYLVPDDLKDIEACFSPGVDTMSEFELGCLNKGMKIYLADNSVTNVNLNISPDKYHFIKKHVGCTNNSDFTTLDQWVNSSNLNNDSDLLLQMDIEGGEYAVLINVSDALMKRFRILVIEFHSLEKLWNPEFFHFAEMVFNKILQTHSCVHIHPKNCYENDFRLGIEIPKIAEFTFIRSDRLKSHNYETQFPHELDRNNHEKYKPVVLPKNWYKSS